MYAVPLNEDEVQSLQFGQYVFVYSEANGVCVKGTVRAVANNGNWYAEVRVLEVLSDAQPDRDVFDATAEKLYFNMPHYD